VSLQVVDSVVRDLHLFLKNKSPLYHVIVLFDFFLKFTDALNGQTEAGKSADCAS
jgi:hypothetical protein